MTLIAQTETAPDPQLDRIRGLVEVLQYMGNDLSPVNAARESFHKASDFELSEDGVMVMAKRDKKLLEYLARHGHWTPFGHTGVTFRIKMPIYVSAQWFKHQVGLVVNSVSRRYVDDTPEFEVGVPWRKRPQEGIKQGSGEVFDEEQQKEMDREYLAYIRAGTDLYNSYLTRGMAPEVARKVLPVSHYTEFWQTGNLESFARIYKLRVDPHAQLETRQYATVIGEHMARLFPQAWAAKIRDFKGEEIANLKAQVTELEAELERYRNAPA